MAAASTAEAFRPENSGLVHTLTQYDSPDKLDQLLQEQDDEMDNFKHKDQIAMIMQSEGFKLNEKNLECPALE